MRPFNLLVGAATTFTKAGIMSSIVTCFLQYDNFVYFDLKEIHNVVKILVTICMRKRLTQRSVLTSKNEFPKRPKK